MDLHTVKMIGKVGKIFAEIGVFCFVLILVSIILGKMFPRWKFKYFQYHTKVLPYLMLAFFVIHGIIMSFVVVAKRKPYFPVFGFYTLLSIFFLILSGIFSWYKLRDRKASPKIRKWYGNWHRLFVVLAVIFFMCHLIEFKTPLISAAVPSIPVTK